MLGDFSVPPARKPKLGIHIYHKSGLSKMKIKKFEVTGLNNRSDFSFDFHDDINILTGANGTGKTTALKLAWYLLSGSTARIRQEIAFLSCKLSTDHFSVTLTREQENDRDINYIFESFKEAEKFHTGSFDQIEDFDEYGQPTADGEDHLRDLIRDVSPGSLYFPTFRRIEGGYSTTRRRRRMQVHFVTASGESTNTIGAQLEQLANDLSFEQHKFVCSISTDDISRLLTQRYAQISAGINKRYTEFSSDILSDIRNWESADSGQEQSGALLKRIRNAAADVDVFRESSLKPFNVVSSLIQSLFAYQGVQVKGLTLGNAKEAIDSDVLSAGEKQMLSFLVYNAFTTNSPFFIDEPELSLHPDWQRRLLPTLSAQEASNQFIISTHSPFIYTKYSDRELPLSTNRGD